MMEENAIDGCRFGNQWLKETERSSLMHFLNVREIFNF